MPLDRLHISRMMNAGWHLSGAKCCDPKVCNLLRPINPSNHLTSWICHIYHQLKSSPTERPPTSLRLGMALGHRAHQTPHAEIHLFGYDREEIANACSIGRKRGSRWSPRRRKLRGLRRTMIAPILDNGITSINPHLKHITISMDAMLCNIWLYLDSWNNTRDFFEAGSRGKPSVSLFSLAINYGYPMVSPTRHRWHGMAGIRLYSLIAWGVPWIAGSLKKTK